MHKSGCGPGSGSAWGGGQQGREAPIHQVLAVRSLGIGEEGGKAGRLERPARGGPRASAALHERGGRPIGG
jgi:hypothetical protein